jgi:hypothetical protein
MAGFTLEEATMMRDLYIENEKKIMSGQEARQGDRQLRYADLDQVRAGRKEWEAKVKSLENNPSGNIAPRQIIPDDM